VTEIRIPHPEKGSRQAFLKFRLRNALDFAMVSVAANITQSNGMCKDARIILGSVAPAPVRARGAEQAIIAKTIDEAAAEGAAQAAAADTVSLSKNEYKIDLVRTLVKRAILSSAGG
jgi:xanthine dehydrogenase YagS FAD-binding subunit